MRCLYHTGIDLTGSRSLFGELPCEVKPKGEWRSTCPLRSMASTFAEGSSVAGSHRGLRPRNRPPRRQHACSSLTKRPILAHQPGVYNGSPKRPKWCPNGSQMGVKWVRNCYLEASWGVSASWRPLEALLDASWSRLGGLQGRKNVLLNGSWQLQEEFQDRFQRS